MTPALIIGPTFVSLSLGGTPYVIYDNDARFHSVKEAIRAKDWPLLENLINTAKAIAKYTYNKVNVYDGEIHYAGKPIHNSLSAKILDFMRDDYPFEPLVAFLDKLMTNPDERSRNQLYDFLERYKMPINDDGNFLAMKAVQKVGDDLYDKYTGKIRNNVGDEPEMDRSKCDNNPNHACAASLHAGNIDYVKWYGHSHDEVILVEINPADVVSCPTDHSYQKLRVCKYKVLKRLGSVADVCGFDKEYAPENNHAKEIYVIEKPNSLEKIKTLKTKWNIVSPSNKVCRRNMVTRDAAIKSMLKGFKNKTWKQLYRKGYRAVQVSV